MSNSSGIARPPKGFTLLEVMIAMAILAGSLTWLVVGISRNIAAENHAKLMTTATFLARGKISAFQDELYEKGFGEFEKEVTGNFEEKGFSRFTWKIVVDKVELPNTEQIQTVLTNAQQAQQTLAGGSTDQQTKDQAQQIGGSSNPVGTSASALGSQYGIIKSVLEQGIRRVTVSVIWYEGRRPFDVSVITFFTDVRTVDQAIQLNVDAAASALGGSAGSSSTTATTGTTK